MMPVKPGYLLLAAGGGVMIWSGLKGKSVSSVFRQLAGGDAPEAAQSSNMPVSGFTPPAIVGTGTPTTVGAGALGEAVTLATSFVSKAPYVYGGTSPSGWDCSGMVQWIYNKLGISLPRTSEEQWAAVQHIDASQLKPGDLVFAQFAGDNASPGHVGIYVGNGQVISAEDQQLGTGYSSLASWGNAIVGYGTP
jgi:cell wall-associated NlpC family hydrolase